MDVASSLTGLAWRKSSACGASSNNCVEAAPTDRAVLVRDSKNQGRVLGFPSGDWATFLTFVHEGCARSGR